MPSDCKLVERAAQATLYIRGHSPAQHLPNFFTQAYGAIAHYIDHSGLKETGPPYAAYYNLDMNDLDVEAGIPVSESCSGKKNIMSGEIPAGRYVALLHVGPYSDVEPSYNFLMHWIEENNLETTGVSYEFYLNDPQDTPPEKLQTQILFPLK